MFILLILYLHLIIIKLLNFYIINLYYWIILNNVKKTLLSIIMFFLDMISRWLIVAEKNADITRLYRPEILTTSFSLNK